MSYNLGAVKAWVRDAANELGRRFGIKTIGGYRAGGSRDPAGHPSGLALDLMVSDPKRGTSLAEYARANARRLGVKYVIWRQRIWSVARSGEGWRPMEDRGSPTQNHMDHVHVSFEASPPAGGPRVNSPASTWTDKPRVPGSGGAGGRAGGPGGSGSTGGRNGRQNGAQGGQVVPAGFVGDVSGGIRDLAVVGAALLGGVALIALGTAATTQKVSRKVAGDALAGPSSPGSSSRTPGSGKAAQAAQVASVLPQGRAAGAVASIAAATGKSGKQPTSNGGRR